MKFFVDTAEIDAIRELAALWDPNLPVDQNEAYVQRAQQLNKDLETTLTDVMEDNGASDLPDDGRTRVPGGRAKG